MRKSKTYNPATLRNAALIRVCQPRPPPLKWLMTSGSRRIDITVIGTMKKQTEKTNFNQTFTICYHENTWYIKNSIFLTFYFNYDYDSPFPLILDFFDLLL